MNGCRNLLFLFAVLALASARDCRFALKYTRESLLNDAAAREAFLHDIAWAEGKFQADGVGYDVRSGHTFDGHELDYATGWLRPGGLHVFSAPSKESLHVALLTLALSGNVYAQEFVVSSVNGSREQARDMALAILERKIASYELFNATYPGYGGFMPWVNVSTGVLTPDDGWGRQVPALDNGELFWALFACRQVLSEIGQGDLARRFQTYMDYQVATAPVVFYGGKGRVRWVSTIRDTRAAPSPDNYDGDANPGDPYEGELFTWMMDLFSSWPNAAAREAPWIAKRPMLVALNYTTRAGRAITVQRGFWYSAHENWKLAFMPYLELDLTRRVFENCERARTLFSAEHAIPGMYACVNDVTRPGKPIPDYVGNVGIPQLAYLTNLTWRPDLITPYSVYPLALVNQTAALVWYHNMLLGPRMQGPFGSTESINVNGTEISPLLTWDSKITTLVGLLGGVSPIVSRAFAERPALQARFRQVVEREYGRVFGQGPLPGEEEPYALPTARIPTAALGNFTGC